MSTVTDRDFVCLPCSTPTGIVIYFTLLCTYFNFNYFFQSTFLNVWISTFHVHISCLLFNTRTHICIGLYIRFQLCVLPKVIWWVIAVLGVVATVTLRTRWTYVICGCYDMQVVYTTIKSLSLLPVCTSATQVAVRLKLDSLPAVPELAATVLYADMFLCVSVLCMVFLFHTCLVSDV